MLRESGRRSGGCDWRTRIDPSEPWPEFIELNRVHYPPRMSPTIVPLREKQDAGEMARRCPLPAAKFTGTSASRGLRRIQANAGSRGRKTQGLRL